MKKYKYNVIYLNGNEAMFFCGSFNEAIVKAMAYAYDKGWDWRIKYITDEEKDTTIKDIQTPIFNYSK